MLHVQLKSPLLVGKFTLNLLLRMMCSFHLTFTDFFHSWLEPKWSEAKVTRLCPTLCNPMDCSLPGSSVHGILWARILKWVALSFSRRSSWPRDRTWISFTAGRFFTNWAQGSLILYDPHKLTSLTLRLVFTPRCKPWLWATSSLNFLRVLSQCFLNSCGQLYH